MGEEIATFIILFVAFLIWGLFVWIVTKAEIDWKKNESSVKEFQDDWARESRMKSLNNKLESLEARVENTECVLGFLADTLDGIIAKERKKKYGGSNKQ